jgi:hypothetical protein
LFGSVPADVRVNPSAKTLNDQYTRFGRCMAEHMRMASSLCEGVAITPDANYQRSLKANP